MLASSRCGATPIDLTTVPVTPSAKQPGSFLPKPLERDFQKESEKRANDTPVIRRFRQQGDTNRRLRCRVNVLQIVICGRDAARALGFFFPTRHPFIMISAGLIGDVKRFVVSSDTILSGFI